MELVWRLKSLRMTNRPREAPIGHADRNFAHLQESLLEHSPIRPEQIHSMAVESPNLEAAAKRYASTLREIAGSPPSLDLVHLGLGPDGHTASLVPGDPVLSVTDRAVALTGVYQGRRRMTLTIRSSIVPGAFSGWLICWCACARVIFRSPLDGFDRIEP